MKTKTLAVLSVLAPTENRANGCQTSGLSSASPASIIGLRGGKAHLGRHVISRFSVLLVCSLSLPATLFAQKQKGTWSDLNGLKSGQGIEVIESNLTSHTGEFVTVTDEMLTLKEHGSDISVKREEVVRVSTSSGPKHGEHAVIGLVVGGAIGAGIGAVAGSRSHGWFSGSGIGALVGVVIGAPIGAGVGAVLPAHTTIYRAEPVAAPH